MVSRASCALIIASGWARCKTFRHALSPPSPFHPSFRAKRYDQSLIGDKAHGAVAVPDIQIAFANNPLDIFDMAWNDTDAPPALSPKSAEMRKSQFKQNE